MGFLGVLVYGYTMLDQVKQTDLPAADEELGITPTPTPAQQEEEKKPDYERTERQRRVLNELFKSIKAQGAIKFNTNSIEQYKLPVDGMYKSDSIRGMSVLVPDIEANKKALHEFIYGPESVEVK